MKLKEKKKEMDQKELDECSFRPNLHQNKEINELAVKSVYGDVDVVSRLYRPLTNQNVREL
jgi:hypothetical protein